MTASNEAAIVATRGRGAAAIEARLNAELADRRTVSAPAPSRTTVLAEDES